MIICAFENPSYTLKQIHLAENTWAVILTPTTVPGSAVWQCWLRPARKLEPFCRTVAEHFVVWLRPARKLEPFCRTVAEHFVVWLRTEHHHFVESRFCFWKKNTMMNNHYIFRRYNVTTNSRIVVSFGRVQIFAVIFVNILGSCKHFPHTFYQKITA
jgi:hypothetical protein